MNTLHLVKKLPVKTQDAAFICFNEKYCCILTMERVMYVYHRETMKEIVRKSKYRYINWASFVSDDELLFRTNGGQYVIYSVASDTYTWEYQYLPNDDLLECTPVLCGDYLLDYDLGDAEDNPRAESLFILNYRTGEINTLIDSTIERTNIGELCASVQAGHAYFYTGYELHDINIEKFSSKYVFQDKDIVVDRERDFIIKPERHGGVLWQRTLSAPDEKTIICDVLFHDAIRNKNVVLEKHNTVSLAEHYSANLADNSFFSESGRYIAIEYFDSRFKNNPAGKLQHGLRIVDLDSETDVYTATEMPIINALQWVGDMLYVFIGNAVYMWNAEN